MAASVLGRQFGLPLLEGVAGGEPGRSGALAELQRLDLCARAAGGREPEYRFKHALIQEAAYRTLVGERARRACTARPPSGSRSAYAGREDEVAGPARAPLARRRRRGQGGALPHARGRPRPAGVRARRGDRALPRAAADPRAARRAARRSRSCCSSSRSRCTCRCGSRRRTRPTSARSSYWTPPEPPAERRRDAARSRRASCRTTPTRRSAIAWPNIQLCMQLFDRLVEAWPERTIVPSLAERWEISDDGLRYVFHLRRGAHVVRRRAAHRARRRVRDQARARTRTRRAPRWRSTSCWSTGRTTTSAQRRTRDAIGVRALDDRTVEFRLAAPAPYFMSVMNRPDGGPQPRHAIERDGDAWTRPDAGGERRVPRSPSGTTIARAATRRRAEYAATGQRGDASSTAQETRRRDRRAYAARRARHGRRAVHAEARRPDARRRPPTRTSEPRAWSGYLAFDHADPARRTSSCGARSRYAVDRERARRQRCPSNMVVATGGVVPPALQGHTPDIALAVRPGPRARAPGALAGFTRRRSRLAVLEREAAADRSRSWTLAGGARPARSSLPVDARARS